MRNLGVWFDSDFSFSKHVQNVCKGCFSQLRDFRNIRQFLTQAAAVLVANAFVSSQLDYCSSLFRSLSKVNLHRLQYIQNSAARIVTNSCKYTRITPVLRKLHWLAIQFCSEFKLATLVYKSVLSLRANVCVNTLKMCQKCVTTNTNKIYMCYTNKCYYLLQIKI